MPYKNCPACGLTSYTAGRITQERFPRCGAPLEIGKRAEDRGRRWNLGALRLAARTREAEHGTR
jgi:hypothetical protein